MQQKLRAIRETLAEHDLGAIRLRGVDWFSWATGGGSNVVIFTNELGVADVLVTPSRAWVLTSKIEALRLREEEVPQEFDVWSGSWQDPSVMERLVRDQAGGKKVASDRPRGEEVGLPDELVRQKRRLLAAERERYRKLGREAAEAMTEAMSAATPEQTEWELAGAGARALWARGIHPTLCLVAGEERLPKHRHPFPANKPLGRRAMMVFCGRRHGLYANLTRFVSFGPVTDDEKRAFEDLLTIEAAAFRASTPGARLGAVYTELANAYTATGHGPEIDNHHQGGPTGYLSREAIALPDSPHVIDEYTALAWNPSLPGAKVEDTVITHDGSIEVLTNDPRWPGVDAYGLRRPWILEKG